MTAGEAGATLVTHLAGKLGVSRREARELVSAGAVRIDGRAARGLDKSRAVAEGWQISLAVPERAESQAVVPEPEAEVTILAEGADWVVVDKPAGMPVHPLRAGERGTVLNALVARYPELAAVGEGGLRGGVVHRLDVETSGALLFAKTAERYQRLREAFRGHRVLKRYRCVVGGQMRGRGKETMQLVVARRHPATVRVLDAGTGVLPSGARVCNLSWKAVEVFRGATLVEVELGTGFLHQIRVMLAQLGHAVLGDGLYGGGGKAQGWPRLMLHACELAVDDIHAISPDPPDFAGLVQRLRGAGEPGRT